MKPMTDKSDEKSDNDKMPEKIEDYYYSGEYTEPQFDDAELLERFLKLLKDTSGSGLDDVNYYDMLPEPDTTAFSQNSSGKHVGYFELFCSLSTVCPDDVLISLGT